MAPPQLPRDLRLRLGDAPLGRRQRAPAEHRHATKALALDVTQRPRHALARGNAIERAVHFDDELAFVGAGDRFVSASRDQTVRLWDIRSGLELEAFDAQAGQVLDVAVSPDGKLLASAHFDTTVRIWDVATGKELGRCQGHKQMPTALAFAPDGKRLYSAGQDHTLRLWDAATCRELASVDSHSAGINALSLSPDGKRVVTAGTDKGLVISQAQG